MSRLVVLGCGTGIGKTRVSVALTRELTRLGYATLGLKPIESGIEASGVSPPPGSDAYALASASSLHTNLKHPLYGLLQPVSPHLAARAAKTLISVATVANWLSETERQVAPLVSSDRAIWTIVETAGGVFSPLSEDATNFDLARALEPAIWLLVAPDSLGVLHDVSATLEAMRARGRAPEHVALSAAREPDASTGSNASELAALRIVTPTAVLARNDDRGVKDLVRALLERA